MKIDAAHIAALVAAITSLIQQVRKLADGIGDVRDSNDREVIDRALRALRAENDQLTRIVQAKLQG